MGRQLGHSCPFGHPTFQVYLQTIIWVGARFSKIRHPDELNSLNFQHSNKTLAKQQQQQARSINRSIDLSIHLQHGYRLIMTTILLLLMGSKADECEWRKEQATQFNPEHKPC